MGAVGPAGVGGGVVGGGGAESPGAVCPGAGTELVGKGGGTSAPGCPEG